LKKGICALLIGMLVLTGLLGCSDKAIVQEDSESLPNAAELTEAQSAGDARYDLDGLKERLMGAQSIELKDAEGVPIGALQSRDAIIAWVEHLFNYPIQENYSEAITENKVVGPLNFYFSGDEDIYGLVKEDYVHVEGYYFLITRQQLESMKKQFEGNIVKNPVSGN
jgi:hypothetical protein